MTTAYEQGRRTIAAGRSAYWQAWIPREPVRAVVVVVHGLHEHSARYTDFGTRLAATGFAVYAADAPKLKDFYAEAMGLKVVFESGGDPPGYFLADDRGTAVEIIGRPPGQSGADQRWVCHLAFWVDTREECLRAADLFLDAGVEIEAAPSKHAIAQGFFLYGIEPGGNRIEVTTCGYLVYDP